MTVRQTRNASLNNVDRLRVVALIEIVQTGSFVSPAWGRAFLGQTVLRMLIVPTMSDVIRGFVSQYHAAKIQRVTVVVPAWQVDACLRFSAKMMVIARYRNSVALMALVKCLVVVKTIVSVVRSSHV